MGSLLLHCCLTADEIRVLVATMRNMGAESATISVIPNGSVQRHHYNVDAVFPPDTGFDRILHLGKALGCQPANTVLHPGHWIGIRFRGLPAYRLRLFPDQDEMTT